MDALYLFIHPSVSGHWGCFCHLAIASDGAMNPGLQIGLWGSVFYYFGCIPRSGIAGPCGHSAFNFEELPYCFPQGTYFILLYLSLAALGLHCHTRAFL